jgi:tRNA (guanine-N7-)-methyltransferase
MARRAPEGPFDAATLFSGDGAPGEGPIELEIGFGRGRFLLERARAAPGSRIVGIEIKSKWAHFVEQRRVREGLVNAVALCGDAREVLPRMGPDGVLSKVFLHFPDPWWKKRHAKRRVIDEGFLVQLGRLIAKGGALFVQTDVEERAIDMAAHIRESGLFDVREGFAHENPYMARSNREVRADEDGLPVYRVHATRK